MQIVETDEVLEVIWNIPLGTGSVKIRKTDRYLKNSEVCELQRRDGRHGALRSQLNFTPEGHIHIRWGAAVHRRAQRSGSRGQALLQSTSWGLRKFSGHWTGSWTEWAGHWMPGQGLLLGCLYT